VISAALRRGSWPLVTESTKHGMELLSWLRKIAVRCHDIYCVCNAAMLVFPSILKAERLVAVCVWVVLLCLRFAAFAKLGWRRETWEELGSSILEHNPSEYGSSSDDEISVSETEDED
jgi:hypothetical protein